ncbi:MAG: tetratricopeptide repeat protein [Roseivirga sp.]|nr:tetratricopeptide repeat protein [Roseivirga sp.]
MMKFKNLLLLVFIATISVCNAQPNISAKQWQQDLVYLQKLIDADYSGLYSQINKEDFHKSVEALYQKIPQLSENDIMIGFAKLIALFRIGHSGISLSTAMHGEELKTGFHNLPLNFYLFKDGLYIQAATDEYAEAAGARVLKIGNLRVDKAIEAIRPVVSIENEQFFKAYGIPLLGSPEVLQSLGIASKGEHIPLLLSKNGKEFKMKFPVNERYHVPAEYGMVEATEGWTSSRQAGDAPLWLKNLKQPYSFDYLPNDKALYVRQNQIRNGHGETIHQFYQRVFEFTEQNEVDKLILDLRQNSGGNNYLNKPAILGLIKSKLNKKGQLFTIIGRRTFSAAQNLVNELEYYTETTFIGEPTAENVNFWGDVNIEILPNSGLPVRLSFMWWQDLDPRDERLATDPEITVEPSFIDYHTNHDPVLAAVLSYKVPDNQLIKGLKELYAAGKYDKAEETVRAFVNAEENKSLMKQVESSLNRLGYEFLDENTDTSTAILDLNTRLFPESANAWDSLGESYLNANEFDKAIACYEKAIALDPNGPTGSHAREVLERIKMHMGK